MERTRQIAFSCVGRAVMFGWLAIVCVMFAFSFSPVAAFRAGAVLALGMSAILVIKAFIAMRQQPKYTEVWIYLEKHERPRNDPARAVFMNMMREVYGYYAQRVFVISCVFFVTSLIFIGLGFESTLPVAERIAAKG
jgi:hypothetical protein